MSVSGRILRGTGWMTLAGVLARVGTFAANLIVIRLLGLERLGELGLIESWLGLVVMFSVFGLGVAATRYVARHVESDAARAGEVAGAALFISGVFSVVVALLTYAGISLLSLDRLDSGGSGLIGAVQVFVAGHGWLLIGLIIVTTLRETVLAVLQGLQVFHLFIYLNIFTGVLSVPLYFALTQANAVAGVLTARLLLAAGELLLALLMAHRVAARLGIHASLHHLIENARALFGFALPTFLGQAVANPAKTLMISLLAAQSGGAVQVGLLTTAGRLVGLASFLPASMAAVLMPILATVWGEGHRDRFRNGVLSALRMMWLISLPIILFFMAAAPVLLNGLFGPEYVEAATVTFVMLAVALLAMINETPDRTLAAANRQWLSTANNLVWVALFVGLGLRLTPVYAATGYAAAYFISFAIYVGWQLGVLRILFQIPFRPLIALAGVSVVLVVLARLAAGAPISATQVAFAGGLTLTALLLEWHFFVRVDERQALRAQAQRGWMRMQALRRRSKHPAPIS